jgi:hypothetical protein
VVVDAVLLQVLCWLVLLVPQPARVLRAAFQEAKSRSPHGALTIPCENCHLAQSWRPIRKVLEFDHNKTKYPLRGMHEKVQCTLCHSRPVFTDVGKACQDCHADIHQRKMGPDCAQCHTVMGWEITTQQVKRHENRFPLLGAHAAVACEECHKNGVNVQFQGLPTDCISCHAKDYQQATNPNHIQMGFSTTCQACHSMDSWLGAKFDHNATGFPLTNAHATVPCLSCHVNNNYHLQIALNDCGNVGCHLTTWQKTNNPVHSAAGSAFAAANCAVCHTTVGWDTASFNHSVTGFLLTNGHANVPCASCHINNNYNLQITANDCGNAGCHLTTWQKTNNPVHSAAGSAFAAANCAVCHTTVGWDTASFNHSITGFALTGAHSSPSPTPCSACHVNDNYNLTSADCYGCHQTAWNSTATLGGSVPNHIQAGFPTSQCASCHDTISWADATFNHASTGFPLTNGHANVACGSCHINNNYNLKTSPTSCGDTNCHLTLWQQTNNPTHATAGPAFSAANCANCHTTKGWDAASFDHSVTGFTLTGTHASPTPTPCASCHTNNNYTLNSTDCMGCHASSWNSTASIGGTVPNHIAAGFPNTATMCATCHPITKWADGSFNHSTTGWALTGYHLTNVSCNQCHVNNNYGLTATNTACYGCHSADWQSTVTLGGSVPNHIAAGYPTTCDTCHNTTSWLGATFNHTYFPIPHHGSVCSDCHQVSTDYSSFTCINCHTTTAHQQTQTDNEHRGVSGYSYGPETCYTCHKHGGGG